MRVWFTQFPFARRTLSLNRGIYLNAKSEMLPEAMIHAEDVRIESDSMGPMKISAGAYWGAQTQRFN
jgi:hypothetical protein